MKHITRGRIIAAAVVVVVAVDQLVVDFVHLSLGVTL